MPVRNITVMRTISAILLTIAAKRAMTMRTNKVVNGIPAHVVTIRLPPRLSAVITAKSLWLAFGYVGKRFAAMFANIFHNIAPAAKRLYCIYG